MISRIITVTGDDVVSPKNFTVLTGTCMQELIQAAGGLKTEAAKIVSGGPMMGFALYDLNVPCVKTTSAFLCMEHDPVSEATVTACINCGRCCEGLSRTRAPVPL